MRAALALLLALALAGPAASQGQPVDLLPPPLVVIDTERLFAESRYAESLRAEIEAEATILRAENEDLVAELTAEERRLTERRPDMDPQEFRAEAETFDQKVQEIRRERDQKEAELQQRRTEIQTRFFEETRPLVGRLMVERGALAVVDSRSVVVAVRAADITDEAIALVDATLLADPAAPPTPETDTPEAQPDAPGTAPSE